MTKTLLSIIFIFIITHISPTITKAVDPDEFLQDPKLELRARKISKIFVVWFVKTSLLMSLLLL